MPLDSNIDDLGQWLHETIAEFGFDTPDERHGTVGMACADAVASAIQELGGQGLGPDMEDWPVNKPDYMAWKARNFSGERRTNFRTHQMLSKTSLMGDVEVTHDTVTMGYGTGDSSPDEIRRDPIPDTAKAKYAHEQGREFYEVGEVAEDAVFDTIADALGKHIERSS